MKPTVKPKTLWTNFHANNCLHNYSSYRHGTPYTGFSFKWALSFKTLL